MKYLFIIAIIVVGWAPWFTKEEALKLVDEQVNEARKKSNVCPITVHKDSIRKVPFGYTEMVSYDCTNMDEVYGITKSTDVVFITFYKSVIGVPVKVVRKSL